MTETFIATILPNTPPSVMMAVALLCVLYASYRGVESLSRAAQVLLPVIGAGIVVLLLFSLPRLDTSRLYPFWGPGGSTILAGGAMHAGIVGDAIVLLAIGHAFRDAKTLRRSGYWAILLFGITTALMLLVLVTVFGAPDASHQPFPLYNLARLVYLGRFLQRTESLVVMLWFFTLAIRLAALFHSTVATLTEVLALPYYRPLTFPVALLGFALALVPEDQVAVMRALRDWIGPAGILVMLVPAVLLLLAAIRGKEGIVHEA
jgi:spore germination protein (amino acid permease)